MFSAVGDAISAGYENTVSYFNAYYNAERTFVQAEEEILEAERSSRTRRSSQSPQPSLIPALAKQKLMVVIDKCSNILSFHATSGFVDDALLLVGKSYFYQGEYVRAERKFTELLTQFPTSSLVSEGELWLIRTMIRTGKNEEALPAAEALTQESMRQGESGLAAEAFVLVGDLHVIAGNTVKALESFEKAGGLTSNERLMSAAKLKIGGVLYSQKEYRKAADAYLQAGDLARDPVMQFEGKLEALRAFRANKDFEEALRIADELLADFRFSTWSKETLFERGLTFAAGGSRKEAMADFQTVDSTSARTEIGVKAAYELAILLENYENDYRGARDAYVRALSYPVASIAPEARKRQNALNRCLLLYNQMAAVDSLLDFGLNKRSKTEADSAATRSEAVKIDSLRAVRARLAYDLGEVYYAELEKPDSAVFWYREALSSSLDSTRSSRMMYVLAELARTYPEKGYGDSRILYQRLLDDYPDSPFAREAKIQMGMTVSVRESSPADSLYKEAERLLETGKPDQAVAELERLIQSFPWSPLAAKSRYAIGWIYEYRLSRPDSAFIHYQAVVEQYGNTTYAVAARPRLNSETPSDTSARPERTARKEKEIESEKEDQRSKKPSPLKELRKE